MNFVIVLAVLAVIAMELWLKAEENGLTAPPGPVIPPAKTGQGGGDGKLPSQAPAG